MVTHDAQPLLTLLQSFYSSLYRHKNDVQRKQVLVRTARCFDRVLWSDFTAGSCSVFAGFHVC